MYGVLGCCCTCIVITSLDIVVITVLPLCFYGLPKIHKTGTPHRVIVSSRGSVTYGVAKVLSKVHKPLVSKSPH